MSINYFARKDASIIPFNNHQGKKKDKRIKDIWI